ncbi:hypothetical protein D8Y22_11215 [Salinadaptatus halalkaliphilus]|uniref:Uncharacterized protein n=1 Tax=Salinadaptatus halalkaliphilus TaxID=2419781 RepID=A0A4S3TNF4_9EURY|nr:hypothetical protein D8Y22_11215 [Salinadaptatus halalkaliphilus]
MQYESSRGNEYCPIDDGTAGHPTGQENTPDSIPSKTHPCHTADAQTRDRPSEQFSAERPKGRAIEHEEIIVAGEGAVILEPMGGDC